MPDTDTRSESGSTALMSAKELFVKALKALNSEIASEDIRCVSALFVLW